MSETNRVLVVDDEPNIVDVISMALRFQGFAVESAGTGADALTQVANFRPDLIARAGPSPGQDPRADDGRRRLRHQALQPRGAARPRSQRPAPHGPRRAGVQ